MKRDVPAPIAVKQFYAAPREFLVTDDNVGSLRIAPA